MHEDEKCSSEISRKMPFSEYLDTLERVLHLIDKKTQCFQLENEEVAKEPTPIMGEFEVKLHKLCDYASYLERKIKL